MREGTVLEKRKKGRREKEKEGEKSIRGEMFSRMCLNQGNLLPFSELNRNISLPKFPIYRQLPFLSLP